MELKIGDLVQHNKHGFYGIVVTGVLKWGAALVCRVEWCDTGKNNVIDISFLDKLNST
jgi:hypothetical protein